MARFAVSSASHATRTCPLNRLAAGIILLVCCVSCESPPPAESPGSLESSRASVRVGAVPDSKIVGDAGARQDTAGSGDVSDASAATPDSGAAVRDAATSDCGRSCTSNDDCSADRQCIEFVDGMQCAPKECAGCAGLCDYDLVTCAFDACFTGATGTPSPGEPPPDDCTCG